MGEFLTADKLMRLCRCSSWAGLRLWLRKADIPFSENGQGAPQVLAQLSRMVPQARDPIDAMLSEAQSFKRAVCGVYLLKAAGNVLYVGLTTSLFNRMGKHLSGPIDFDELVFVPALKKDVRDLETELIARYNPPFNVQKKIPQSQKVADLQRVKKPSTFRQFLRERYTGQTRADA